jgi:thioredoxin-related protein
MKKLLVIMILLAPLTWAKDEVKVAWQDYEDARELNSEKMMFVFTEMRLCSVCQKMKKEVFTQPEIVNLLNDNFIPVKETNYLPTSFTFSDLKDKAGNDLNFRAWPAYIFLKGDDYKIIYGYKSPEEMKTLLETALGKANS